MNESIKPLSKIALQNASPGPVRQPHGIVQLVFAVLGILATAANAHALNCAVPAHRIIMHCSTTSCDEGFRVYQLPTIFPCEYRPQVESASEYHSKLFANLFSLANTPMSAGVFEVSFISCSKSDIDSIPWDSLSLDDENLLSNSVSESPWRIRRSTGQITVLGRSGCALSFLLNPVAQSSSDLEGLKDEVSSEETSSFLWYHVRLWVWPLLLYPFIAVCLFWLCRFLLHSAVKAPKLLLWALLPLALQIVLFLSVLDPATNRWMGPYRLIFFIPCAVMIIFWLLELLQLWIALQPILDALGKQASEEPPDEF